MVPTCDYPDCSNDATDDGRCSVHSGTRIAGEPVQHPSDPGWLPVPDAAHGQDHVVPEGEQLLIDQVAAAEPADPAVDPEAEPVDILAQLPGQEQFDQGVVAEMLGAARRQYAIAKSRYYLTRAGAPDPLGEDKNHPNEHLKDLKKHATGIAELERLLTEGMPPPPALYLAEGGDGGS